MQEAIDVLSEGPAPPPFVEFTVPEGLTLPEITEAMADGISTLDVDLLNQLVASGQVRSRYQPPEVPTLEGFLFPETYRLDEGADELTALQRMVNQFDGVADQLDLERRGGPARADAVPGADRGLAGPRGGGHSRGLADDRPGHLQPPGPGHSRSASTPPSATSWASGRASSPSPTWRSTRRTTAASGPGSRRRRSPRPDGLRSRPRSIRPPGPWLYYVLDPEAEIEGGHFFTDDYSEFLAKKDECAAAGLGCG